MNSFIIYGSFRREDIGRLLRINYKHFGLGMYRDIPHVVVPNVLCLLAFSSVVVAIS